VLYSTNGLNILLQISEDTYVAIYQTAHYQVKPQAVNKVKQAIEDFVTYVKANEPGTQLYSAWQEKNDPTRFVHLFIFKDEAAQTIHSESQAVRHFESIYGPELVGGDVVFTDYELVATNDGVSSRP
jgi:quinol monooxygenase YgiN